MTTPALKTGEPAIEIYDYDAGAQQLSLHLLQPERRPAGNRLSAEASLQAGKGNSEAFGEGAQFPVQAAAWLPTPRRGTYMPRMISDDGSRVFFNSFDALVPQDTNGVQDVYEWEAQGTRQLLRRRAAASA